MEYHSKRPTLASVATTEANLVFTGELTEDFLVLDAGEGNVLYRFNTGGPAAAGVFSYAIGGKQYVDVMSGAAVRFWRTPPRSFSYCLEIRARCQLHTRPRWRSASTRRAKAGAGWRRLG